VTWHFKPFYIATNEGVREADLTNPEDAKAIQEYVNHQRRKLNMGRAKKPIEARLRQKVMVDAKGCWQWTGSKNNCGYGRVSYLRENRLAHRVSYVTFKGEIPNGMTIDHLCRNRACINPDHLEAVPIGVNVLRGDGPSARHARKTHCPAGHPYSGENLYLYGTTRQCVTCSKNRAMMAYNKKKKEMGEIA
jgi:hypothetical protein